MAGVAQSSLMRLSDSEKQQYAQWATQVLAEGYLARHEFRTIGYLPPKVLHDIDVLKIGVTGNRIEISDYLLRHGSRDTKDGRGAALRAEDIASLPDKLEASTWTFDPKHNNVIAFFEIDHPELVGKAVVHFQYIRKGKGHNAVITTGVVKRSNMGDGGKREIRSATDCGQCA